MSCVWRVWPWVRACCLAAAPIQSGPRRRPSRPAGRGVPQRRQDGPALRHGDRPAGRAGAEPHPRGLRDSRQQRAPGARRLREPDAAHHGHRHARQQRQHDQLAEAGVRRRRAVHHPAAPAGQGPGRRLQRQGASSAGRSRPTGTNWWPRSGSWTSAIPTRLYDAIDQSLDRLAAVEGRRVIVVLTDGDDNASKIGQGDVLSRALADEVMIYGIGLESDYFDGIRRVRTNPDRVVRKLAEETGGGYYLLKATADLNTTFTRIAQELHSQYVLGFSPTAPRRQGPQADRQRETPGHESPGAQVVRGVVGRGAGPRESRPGGTLHEDRRDDRHGEEQRRPASPRCWRSSVRTFHPPERWRTALLASG